MSEQVRLAGSPFQPNVEVGYDLVIKLGVPYSAEMVTVVINPNITDYREEVSENIRQVMTTTPTDETRTVRFDMGTNKVHTISVGDRRYEITLEQIGTTIELGQEFRCYDFSVSQL